MSKNERARLLQQALHSSAPDAIVEALMPAVPAAVEPDPELTQDFAALVAANNARVMAALTAEGIGLGESITETQMAGLTARIAVAEPEPVVESAVAAMQAAVATAAAPVPFVRARIPYVVTVLPFSDATRAALLATGKQVFGKAVWAMLSAEVQAEVRQVEADYYATRAAAAA